MQWDDVPISYDAIARVHQLAEMQKQPRMVDGPIFEWQPGVPVLDESERPIQFDETFDTSDPADDTDSTEDTTQADTATGSDEQLELEELQQSISIPNVPPEFEPIDNEGDEDHNMADQGGSVMDMADDASVESYDMVNAEAPIDDARGHGHNLHSSRQRDYSKHVGKINEGEDYTFIQSMNVNDMKISAPHRLAAHAIFSQITQNPTPTITVPNKILKGSPQM